MNKASLSTLALASLVLVGCSSTDDSLLEQTSHVGNVDTTLYLRGDFTLWEAQKAYQLTQQTANVYSTKVKFGSIGKAYEFKVADANWTQGYNCGFKNEDLDKFLEVGIPVQANCDSVYNYFSFTPYEAGWYEVSINFRNKSTPLVTINQIFE